MLNWIWLGLILIAVLFGAFTGRMEAVQDAAFASAKSAVSLVISMTGFMIFMLGLMEIARQGGLLVAIGRLLAICDLTLERSLVWLFPGSKTAPPMGRPSRQAALFERYADELAELIGTELAEGETEPA